MFDTEEVRQIDNAIDGLSGACDGKDFGHLFADPVDREPELPEPFRQTWRPIQDWMPPA